MKKLRITGQYSILLLITLVFILINSILCANEWYYLSILPVVLFLIYLGLISIDKLLYVTVFLVPVSIPLESFVPGLGFNLQLPSEPVLILILLIFFFKVIYERKFDKQILLHPVSLAIYANLIWIFVTSLTSSLPLVSFKFLISRIWFLVAFYFLATQLFTKKKGVRNYFWAYLPLMLLVIGIAVMRLSKFGLFNQQMAHLSASPFFNDHTSYGATLAMLMPFSIAMAVYPRHSPRFKAFCWFLTAILAFALLLSYSRAAWISILVAGGIFLVMYFKIQIRTLFVLGLVGGTLFYINRTDIFLKLEKNRQDSSKDLAKHIQSISNISTDASNVERLNRWNSAYRMFQERPFFGWGPGTYMFNYAPFQISNEKTPISTNRGNRGNAHSEYIGPLAESGVLGTVTFLIILIATGHTAVKIYSKAKGGKSVQILVLAATSGLITYYTHGILNNFLDTDKASCLFWGYTAMIVALDVYHMRSKEELPSKSELQEL